MTENIDKKNTDNAPEEKSVPQKYLSDKKPGLEESDFRPDPEVRARNENFMMTIMAISFTMIISLILAMAGLTSAFMADQVKGLHLVAWSMAPFCTDRTFAFSGRPSMAGKYHLGEYYKKCVSAGDLPFGSPPLYLDPFIQYGFCLFRIYRGQYLFPTLRTIPAFVGATFTQDSHGILQSYPL